MDKKSFLLLDDGTIYHGKSFGGVETTYGEVVFNTSMYGYQEMLTDPSYSGQILVLTYPLVGNYGINKVDGESKQIQVRGLIVREHCTEPSHTMSDISLQDYLESNGIPAMSEIDTRSLVRRLRSKGVMMGILSSEMSPEEAKEEIKRLPRFGAVNYVSQVTAGVSYEWDADSSEYSYQIVLVDCGLKYNIPRILSGKGCRCIIVPSSASADDILSLSPDGILISPGPGDPAVLNDIERTVGSLLGRVPLFGICLGHQLIARALGADTFKLKFGHRGGNHPVMDLHTRRVFITAQNHGYAVDADTLPAGLEVNHVNHHDGTVEGLMHRDLPIISIQYHAEGSPGPEDNLYIFDRYLEMIDDFNGGKKRVGRKTDRAPVNARKNS
ncbi:MAG: glutamine-hydrolyzing carbamoyl-phosphate synthase small subunit [Dehalococcoidia bacterium]